MVNKVSNAGSKSSNKLLLMVLLITVIATVWTVLEGDSTTDDAAEELVASKSSREVQRPPERSQIPADISQHPDAQSIDSLSNRGNLIPWQNLKREPLTNKPYDVFKVHSWIVIPPVKKLKPQPPPPPVAPPAPFTYMGKLEGSPKGTLVFLMANNKLYSVAKGEKIDQQWRFETEDANALRLTYLPFNLVQTLSKSAKPSVVATVPLATAELIQ